MISRFRLHPKQQRRAKLVVLALAIGAIAFRLMPSTLSDEEFKAVVIAEIYEHQSVYETGEAVEPFKYSDQADEWARLSRDVARFVRATPDFQELDMTADVTNFQRVDAFGQPRARFTAYRGGRACLEQQPKGFPCKEFDTRLSGYGEWVYVELIDVEGRWHIGHVEPAEGLFPGSGDPTYRLCFSFERKFADCEYNLARGDEP